MAAAVVVAVAAAAVTTRDVAPGTENAPADSEQLVVYPNCFVFVLFLFKPFQNHKRPMVWSPNLKL